MQIRTAFDRTDVRSGVTMVDTSVLPWPGFSFGHTPSSTGDDVEQSYVALAEHLDIRRDDIVTATQVHGSNVIIVDDERPDPSIPADALVTNRERWVLGVKLADCCGVLLIDPVHRAIAAIHSGWRGTAGDIVGAVLTKMHDVYATQASDVYAWLSPCASGDVYEVRDDVASVLPDFCTPVPGTTSQWTFDNHAALTAQLRAAGVRPSSITCDPSCTITDVHWHSHRRDGIQAGRMLAFIGLRPMAGK